MSLRSKRALPEDLIESLHEVAAAVAAKRSLDDVLETIVERAESITHTDKAVVCLVHEDDPGQVDVAHLAVRGLHDLTDESWWLGLLESAAPSVFNGSGRVRIRHRESDSLVLVVPVRLADQPIGLLGAINAHQRGFTSADEAFLSILGSFAAVAIENTRLAEEGRYTLLSSERSRIAREMHDGLAQSLFSISLGLELCKRQLWHDPSGVSDVLGNLQEQLRNAMDELRRYIYDLRPLKLSELGLVGAVQEWVKEVTLGMGINGEVRVTGHALLLGSDQELCLYRIAKEAVSNAVRHAAARNVVVRVCYTDDETTVYVQDDGVGFSVDDVVAGSAADGGMGLRDMRLWTDQVGGSMSIESGLGTGTCVTVRVPRCEDQA